MFITCVNLDFKSDLRAARKVVNTVLEGIRNNVATISEEELFELRVIYSELINNAIIHGNKEDRDKKVKVTVKIDNDMIFSAIVDEGDGFEYTKWFIEKNYYEKVFSDHGRGLLLVSSLTDSIAFNEKGNMIEFYKLLARSASIQSGMSAGAYSIA